jgi:hypothetical protein
MLKRKKPPVRTYTVTLTGELDGFVLTMTGMTTADLIRISGAELPTHEALELVLDHVVAHNFDVEDLRELEAWIAVAILSAWSETVKDTAVPPESATS